MAIPYSTPSTLSQYTADNTYLTAQISQVKSTISSQTSQLASLKAKIQSLQTAIGQAQGVEALDAAKASYQKNLSTYNGLFSQAQTNAGQITSLQAAVNQLQSQLTTLQNQGF